MLMIIDNIKKYSNMMPEELKMLVNDCPRDDLRWGLVMYLFANTGRGNIITLGKMSDFFGMKKDVLFDILNEVSGLWVVQYLNKSEYGKIYYSYEITEVATDFMVKLIELLDPGWK